MRVSREKDDDRRLMHRRYTRITCMYTYTVYLREYTRAHHPLHDLARDPPRTADRMVDVGCDRGEAARCAPARRSFLLLLQWKQTNVSCSPLAPAKGAIKFLGILDGPSFYSRVDKETSPFSPVGKRSRDISCSRVSFLSR